MIILQTIAQTVLAVIAVILLVRLNGLRSFSKMSSFDFALTVACGSILATMMTTSENPWPGLIALVTLFAMRHLISRLRIASAFIEDLSDNEPLILAYDGKILHDNLRRSRVSEAELYAKLREANALHLNEVRAVVLETTGDVSVLHGKDIDATLLRDVDWGSEPVPTVLASQS